MDKPIIYWKVVLESHSEIPGVNDQKTHRTHEKKKRFNDWITLPFHYIPAIPVSKP